MFHTHTIESNTFNPCSLSLTQDSIIANFFKYLIHNIYIKKYMEFAITKRV
jgi:hypothetical protein